MKIIFVKGQETFTLTCSLTTEVPRPGDEVTIEYAPLQYIDGKVERVSWFYKVKDAPSVHVYLI